MRRMQLITALCLFLLFVPIYLWKVQGITFWSHGNAPAAPAPRYDAKKDAPHDDIVEMLRESLIRYEDSGVQGYTCTIVMHERVKGKLKPPEVLDCWFLEKPFSVLVHWREGADRVAASLYVEGSNDGKMCVRPANPAAKRVFGTVNSAVDSDDARGSTRYMITEFGIRCGTERTYKTWKSLKDRGVKLNIEYLGMRHVDEVGGRECHVVKRYCDPPEEEGLTEITLYIDAETKMQVGSILKAGDELIGEYFFKDIVINPTFDANLFRAETLKKY